MDLYLTDIGVHLNICVFLSQRKSDTSFLLDFQENTFL